MVVGGLGLLVVVGWLWVVGSGCGLCCLWCFFGSRMYYFIVVDILFYCDVYIIFIVLKAKINQLLQYVSR